MTIEADMYTHLTASTGLTAMVGTKIRPGIAGVNDTLPYIVYERLATDYPPWLLGKSKIANTRISYDCFSVTYSSAQAIAEEVFLRMHGKSGTIANVSVDSILVENRFDDYIPPKEASDTGTHVCSLTISLWHRPASLGSAGVSTSSSVTIGQDSSQYYESFDISFDTSFGLVG